MPHAVAIPVALGSSQVGLELRARDGAGGALAAAVTEEGGGAYTALVTVPDGYRGAVRFEGRVGVGAWSFKASTALNPEESENGDVKTSSRAAPDDIPPAPDLSLLDVAVSSRVATGDARLGHLDVDVSSRASGANYTAARAALLDHLVRDVPDVAALATEANVDTLLARLSAVRAAALDRLDVAVSSRATPADVPAAVDVSALARTDDARFARLDATVSSRARPADIPPAADLGPVAKTADPRLAHLDADISSRAVPADVAAARDAVLAAVAGVLAEVAGLDVPPTVGEVASAVWEVLIADHGTPGTTGGQLTAAGGHADPLLNLVSGYPPGSAGRALSKLTGGPVSIVSPFDRTATLRLVVGDDYLLADGRQIDIPQVDGDTWPADLTGWVLKWRAHTVEGQLVEVEADTVAASHAVAPGQVVRVELAAAITSELRVGTWAWRLVATRAGSTITLRHGRLLAT